MGPAERDVGVAGSHSYSAIVSAMLASIVVSATTLSDTRTRRVNRRGRGKAIGATASDVRKVSGHDAIVS